MSGPRATNPSNSGAPPPVPSSKRSTGTAETSSKSKYQQQCEADNAATTDDQKAKPKVLLSNCRFLTPVADLKLNEEFEFAVDVKSEGDRAAGQVSFALFCFVKKDGKEERSRIWTVQGAKQEAKADPVVVAAKKKLIAELDSDQDGKTFFQLEASHPDANEPCTSERVEASSRTLAHWMGGDNLHFQSDRAFPGLGEDGVLIQILSDAVRRFDRPAQPGETVVCFGFASEAGDPDRNRKLSLHRAQVVKAILDRDAKLWGEIAKERFGIHEIQQFLSDLANAFGWACDPGAIDGQDSAVTNAAVQAFQQECNSQWKLGLKEDGVCGPKTWVAVLRSIHGLIQKSIGQDPSKDPSWKKPAWGNAGEGVFGNGEDFATDGDKPEERSVQITFFANGSEKRLKPVAAGEKATKAHNPVQDETKVEKKKLPTLEQILAAPLPGPILHVAFFFDGTDNNRDRDRPLGHDTNVSKLFDLYNHDQKTRFKDYFEGVATGGMSESDFLSGGFCGRGIADRIQRAAARLRQISDQHPMSEIRLSLFGFSRGAATVLSFINNLFGPSKIISNPLKPSFDKIWFVGLFDAVASIGVPGDQSEAGHNLLVLRSRIRTLAHLVSHDERRSLFPLTSVKTGPGDKLPSGWMETPFPGVHSDVGGGYENEVHHRPVHTATSGRDRTATELQINTDKRDYLSRAACWAMYDAARKANVPMYTIRTLEARPSDEVAVLKFLGADIHGETSDNGWTLFKSPGNPDRDLTFALDHLTIPPALLSLWKARSDEAKRMQFMNPHHSDYAGGIGAYSHDSLGWKDPNGIVSKVGVLTKPRAIFYRGSLL